VPTRALRIGRTATGNREPPKSMTDPSPIARDERGGAVRTLWQSSSQLRLRAAGTWLRRRDGGRLASQAAVGC